MRSNLYSARKLASLYLVTILFFGESTIVVTAHSEESVGAYGQEANETTQFDFTAPERFQFDDIVVGTVIALGESPKEWSSHHSFKFQDAYIRVERSYRGMLKQGTVVSVAFLLEQGSPIVDPKKPRLRRSLFKRKANRVFLIVNRNGRLYGAGWQSVFDLSQLEEVLRKFDPQ
jgi:hypothetical protein